MGSTTMISTSFFFFFIEQQVIFAFSGLISTHIASLETDKFVMQI
jgi:hypothetical protein